MGMSHHVRAAIIFTTVILIVQFALYIVGTIGYETKFTVLEDIAWYRLSSTTTSLTPLGSISIRQKLYLGLKGVAFRNVVTLPNGDDETFQGTSGFRSGGDDIITDDDSLIERCDDNGYNIFALMVTAVVFTFIAILVNIGRLYRYDSYPTRIASFVLSLFTVALGVSSFAIYYIRCVLTVQDVYENSVTSFTSSDVSTEAWAGAACVVAGFVSGFIGVLINTFEIIFGIGNCWDCAPSRQHQALTGVPGQATDENL